MENVDLEIETLISSTSGLHNDNIVNTLLQPHFTPENEDHRWHEWQAVGNFPACGKLKGTSSEKWKLLRVENPTWHEWYNRKLNCNSHVESTKKSSLEDEYVEEFVVRGSDVNDVPTEYAIKGLRSHEMPVIGTYVAKSIVPGFRYLVRVLGTGCNLFGGKPLTLERIGMGYGKRLTFQGESLNDNCNYFWSDSIPEGYGFGIHVLDVGTKFDVCDKKDRYVGTAIVESVDLQQQEVFSHILDGAVEKHVSVRFTCTLQYGAEAHGLMSLLSRELVTLQGIAVVTKAKRATNPVITSIVNIALPYLGMCALYPIEM